MKTLATGQGFFAPAPYDSSRDLFEMLEVPVSFFYFYRMEDYLVVGLGLAGISLCETLERNGKSFKVVSDHAPGASRVAGGIYNPVVLKRLSMAWKAPVQLPMVAPFYDGLEKKLGVRIHYPANVLRRLASVEEQNQWFEAADSPKLQPYLATRLVPNQNPNLHAPFGYGVVQGSGRIAADVLIDAYTAQLKAKGKLLETRLDHDLLSLEEMSVAYGQLRARRAVFATGYGLTGNPYFKYLPLQGNKGEYLLIHSPALKEERVIKAAVFLIPLGDDQYAVGATYDWKDQSTVPTQSARTYLEEKTAEIVRCPYRITGQLAGVRPTVIDRRPLVGRHPSCRNLYVLNGFGSRGVMIAPYAAKQLYRAMEHQEPLDPEMDIARFTTKHFSGKIPQHGHRNG